MPLSPITAVAGPESTFGTNLQNPNSSASGIYGFLTRTWQQDLTAIGGDPAQYPTAKSAPNSLQTAVFAYEYNTRGFSAWNCPGCDPVFTQELANAGGPSAFAAPGSLSINPTDYASLDTAGGLQAYFNSNSGGSFVGAATVSSGGGGATSTTPTTSITNEPFQYTYSTLVGGVTQQISTALQATETLVHPYLVLALTVATAFMGLRVMAGRQSFEAFMSFALRATIVGALLQPGSQQFLSWIQQPLMALPSEIGTAFGVPNAGPAAIFDDAAHTLSAITNAIQASIPVSLRAIGNVIFTDLLWITGLGSLVVMFAPFLLATFLLLLMLALAPIPILFAVFPTLDGWTKGYVDVLLTLALVLLAVDVVVSIVEGAIIQTLNGFSPGGSSQADMAGFATLILVLVAMAVSLKYMGPLVARIAGGVSVGLDGAGAWAARQVVRR